MSSFDDGLPVVSELTSAELLVIFIRHRGNSGSLLHNLRRDRPAMAAAF